MGLFDAFFGKKKDNLLAHTNNLSMEEMARIQDSLSDKMDAEVYNNKFNQACRLVPKGNYAEALAIFEDVKAHTEVIETKGTCDNQIGVCYFFLEDYEKAIAYYTSSIDNGFEKGMADDNIWEAYEILYNKTKDKSYIEKYKQQFPQGNSIKKAIKILG